MKVKKAKVWKLNNTVNSIILVGYLGLLFLLFCMNFYLITNYQENNRKQEESILREYVSAIEKAMDNIDNTLYDIYANNKNFSALSGILNEVEEYSNAYELHKILDNRVFLEDDLHGAFMFYRVLEKAWYSGKEDILSAGALNNIKEGLSSQITNIEKSGNRFTFISEDGVCIVSEYKKGNVIICGVYSLGYMERVSRAELPENTQFYIVDNDLLIYNTAATENKAIMNMTKKSILKFRFWENNQYFYGQRVENSNLWICMSVPCSLWTYINVQHLILFLVTIGSVVAVVFLEFFVRKEMVRPFRELTYTMNKIRQGDAFTTPSKNYRFLEIQEVYETLLAMVSEIEKQKLLSYEETIEKQKAQMQYLQLQIKPHFYLNGLKTLNALTMEKDWEKMQELIINISEHLRYLLQAERELVILSKEISFVSNYISLQKYMTGRRIECCIDLDEGLEQYLVPTLCVQTFVENSVKHAKLGDYFLVLKIDISVRLLKGEHGDFLDIIISDNGEGYPELILLKLQQGIIDKNSGIGINNLKRRCQIIFGRKAEYNFYNCNGAISELILPVKRS